MSQSGPGGPLYARTQLAGLLGGARTGILSHTQASGEIMAVDCLVRRSRLSVPMAMNPRSHSGSESAAICSPLQHTKSAASNGWQFREQPWWCIIVSVYTSVNLSMR